MFFKNKIVAWFQGQNIIGRGNKEQHLTCLTWTWWCPAFDWLMFSLRNWCSWVCTCKTKPRISFFFRNAFLSAVTQWSFAKDFRTKVKIFFGKRHLSASRASPSETNNGNDNDGNATPAFRNIHPKFKCFPNSRQVFFCLPVHLLTFRLRFHPRKPGGFFSKESHEKENSPARLTVLWEEPSGSCWWWRTCRCRSDPRTAWGSRGWGTSAGRTAVSPCLLSLWSNHSPGKCPSVSSEVSDIRMQMCVHLPGEKKAWKWVVPPNWWWHFVCLQRQPKNNSHTRQWHKSHTDH